MTAEHTVSLMILNNDYHVRARTQTKMSENFAANSNSNKVKSTMNGSTNMEWIRTSKDCLRRCGTPLAEKTRLSLPVEIEKLVNRSSVKN